MENLIDSFKALMKNTNISEGVMEEIVEMISNKKAAEKAVERDYQNFSKQLDAINKIERQKVLTGSSSISPEQEQAMMDKAEKAGSRYERFKALYDKKYNK